MSIKQAIPRSPKRKQASLAYRTQTSCRAIGAGLLTIATIPSVNALPPLFPAEIELSDLDGTNGFVLKGVANGDRSGYSVSKAGDLNGDGLEDLVIGAFAAGSSAGESYVVFGAVGLGEAGVLQLSNLNGTNGFVLKGVSNNDNSGYSVGPAGDVNGDGFKDLLIGAYGADPDGRATAGESYLVYGGGSLGEAGMLQLSNLNGTDGFVLKGVTSGDRSGRYVSGAGDVNGDGFDDFLIGAIEADPDGRTNAGETYLVYGAGTLGASGVLQLSSLNGVNGVVLKGVVPGDKSPTSVSTAGDVNGDSVADLLIGHSSADPDGRSGAGVTHIVYGGGSIGTGGVLQLSDLDGNNGFVLKGVASSDFSGGSVSSVGDINRDGFNDLFIGASGASPAGESYVFYGSACIGAGGVAELSSLSGANGFVLNGESSSDRSGSSVSLAGDVNGDGIADLLITAESADPDGRSGAGETYIIFGRSSQPNLIAAVPESFNFLEDTSQLITSIDVFSISPQVTVTQVLPLSVGNLTSTSGALGTVTADAAGLWQVTATVNQMNELLDTLTYLPAPNYADNFNITFSITDYVHQNITKTIQALGTPVNDPPILNVPILDQTAVYGLPFNFTFPANTFADPVENNTLSYSANLADGATLSSSWLSFFPSTRHFTGVLSLQDVGDLFVNVTATDTGPGNPTVTDTFTITSEITLSASNLNQANVYTEDTLFDLPNTVVSSEQSNVIADFVLSDAGVGSLTTDTQGSTTSTYSSGAWQASGPLSDVNSLLAGMQFNPVMHGYSNFNITVDISDGVDVPITGLITMQGLEVNDAPYVNPPISDQSTAYNLPFNYTLNAFSDYENNTLSYQAALINGSSLSSTWLSFNPTTRHFTGVPQLQDLGVLNIRVNATETDVVPPLSVTDDFTITSEIRLSATNLNQAGTYTEDVDFDFTDILVTSDQSPITSTLVLSDPALGSFNTDTQGSTTSTYTAGTGTWQAAGPQSDVNALLSGLLFQPTQNVNQNVNISVAISDGVNIPLQGFIPLTGQAVNDAPTVQGTINDQNINVGIPFNIEIPTTLFAEVDEGDTLTWSAEQQGGSALPSWLNFHPPTLQQNGTVNGTALDVGLTPIDLRVTDTASATVLTSFTLTAESLSATIPTGSGSSTNSDSSTPFGLSEEVFAASLASGIFIAGFAMLCGIKWRLDNKKKGEQALVYVDRSNFKNADVSTIDLNLSMLSLTTEGTEETASLQTTGTIEYFEDDVETEQDDSIVDAINQTSETLALSSDLYESIVEMEQSDQDVEVVVGDVEEMTMPRTHITSTAEEEMTMPRTHITSISDLTSEVDSLGRNSNNMWASAANEGGATGVNETKETLELPAGLHQ